jgi:hypothetical protein
MSALCKYGPSFALYVAGSMALWTAPAIACAATIVTAPATLNIQYDAFNFTNTQGIVTFEIAGTSADACLVDLALVRADHLAIDDIVIGSADVHLAVASDPGGANVVRKGRGLWSVRVSSAARTRVTLRFDVIAGGVMEAGTHLEQLSLELRVPDTVASISDVPLAIALSSPPRAQMNITGATGTFGSSATVSTVDFGVMETGAVRRVFLQIRANVRAMLSIESQNSGQLKFEDTGDGVPYEVRLSGEVLDLSRRWQLEVEAPRTMAGAAMPLDLTLGAVGARQAGRYTDTLTIMISAL